MAAMGRPRPGPVRTGRAWRLCSAALLIGLVASLGLHLSFTTFQSRMGRSSSLPLACSPQQEARTRVARRMGPGGVDPVNNISPEMQEQADIMAQRYEDIFLAGNKLWAFLKKQSEKQSEPPKKVYFIGTNGNNAGQVAESVLEALSYIPAPDGTQVIRRKPCIEYPDMKYSFVETDKELGRKSKISAVDLFMEDEEQYRDLEQEIVQEFASEEYDGYPQGCVVGEGAVTREANRKVMKDGLVVWIDVDSNYAWLKTQTRPKSSGVYAPPDETSRPPVWAIANGWDGDIDDGDAKLEYREFLEERRKLYEEIADIRIRNDVCGVEENSYWGASRIIKALSEMVGMKEEAEVGVEEEMLEKDLQKFLDGARLSKYLEPTLKWCDEQGAASIEDIVENVPDLSDALNLKPLERKRLQKAAAFVATA